MKLIVDNDTIAVMQDPEHEYLLDTASVALGYGVSPDALRMHKKRHADELIEGKHFIYVGSSSETNASGASAFAKAKVSVVTDCSGRSAASGAKVSVVNSIDDGNRRTGKRSAGDDVMNIMWTKRGVIRLGMFIRSERARKFRDAAEDLILKHVSATRPSNMPMPLTYAEACRRMAEMVEAGSSIEAAYKVICPNGEFGSKSSATDRPRTQLIPAHWRSSVDGGVNDRARQYLKHQGTFPFFALSGGAS